MQSTNKRVSKIHQREGTVEVQSHWVKREDWGCEEATLIWGSGKLLMNLRPELPEAAKVVLENKRSWRSKCPVPVWYSRETEGQEMEHDDVGPDGKLVRLKRWALQPEVRNLAFLGRHWRVLGRQRWHWICCPSEWTLSHIHAGHCQCHLEQTGACHAHTFVRHLLSVRHWAGCFALL